MTKVEISKRVEALSMFQKAVRKIMTTWLTDTVKEAKVSAGSLKKTAGIRRGSKSGQLIRNIDFILQERGNVLHGEAGTGVGRAKSVVYSYIQDKGGTIRKKNKMLTIPLGDTKGRIANFRDGFFVKSKKGNVLYCQRQGKRLKRYKGGTIRKKNKMLTIPLGDTKGRIANFRDGFFVKSKKGNVLYCQRQGKRLKPLFVLKEQVEIPATYWFSSVIDKRQPVLNDMMKPENIFREALKLAGGL